MTSRAAPASPWHADGRHLVEHWIYVQGLLKKLDPDFVLDPDAPGLAMPAFFAFTDIMYGPGHSIPPFQYDLRGRVGRVTAPTLIVGSPTDTCRKYHDAARALMPHAQAHLFDGIHPLYQFDRPARAREYAMVIDQFLRRDTP